MAKVLITEGYLSDIADAIREKKASEDTYTPAEMADAIESIQTGAAPTGTINISTNGTHDVTDYANANVSVPTGTARSSSDLTASNLTVTAPAGLYASDATKTLSDANLVAGNIKKDVTIFGTTGTYEGSGGGDGGGNKSYIIKDGKIQSGYVLQPGSSNLVTEETGAVDYVKFTSNGNNYAWVNVAVDMTNYFGAVLELAEIDGHYGTGYANITGISIGDSLSANQTMYANGKCLMVPSTGYIPNKMYMVGRPSNYTNAYLKLSNSGGGAVPGTSGVMNIRNLYLLGE